MSAVPRQYLRFFPHLSARNQNKLLIDPHFLPIVVMEEASLICSDFVQYPSSWGTPEKGGYSTSNRQVISWGDSRVKGKSGLALHIEGTRSADGDRFMNKDRIGIFATLELTGRCGFGCVCNRFSCPPALKRQSAKTLQR